MNFSGKGNKGWTSSGPVVQHRTQTVSVPVYETRLCKEGNEVGINYWYEYANGLAAQVQGLIIERDDMARIAMERKAIDAGLRAVIQAFIKDLQVTNPSHPLLDKKIRDQIFDKYEQEQIAKAVAGQPDKKMWKRLKPEACHGE
jgi:hypothetical protein